SSLASPKTTSRLSAGKRLCTDVKCTGCASIVITRARQRTRKRSFSPSPVCSAKKRRARWSQRDAHAPRAAASGVGRGIWRTDRLSARLHQSITAQDRAGSAPPEVHSDGAVGRLSLRSWRVNIRVGCDCGAELLRLSQKEVVKPDNTGIEGAYIQSCAGAL